MAYEAGVIIGAVGVLWYLAILMINTSDEHMIMKFFYMMASVWMMVGVLNLGLQVAIDDSAGSAVQNALGTMYGLGVWVAIIVSSYFLIYYIWAVFKNLNKVILNKKRGNNG